MTSHTTSDTPVGGFAGNPAESYAPPAAGSCCGTTSAGESIEAAAGGCCGSDTAGAASSCCGSDTAGAASSCCGSSGVTDEAVTTGGGCCG